MKFVRLGATGDRYAITIDSDGDVLNATSLVGKYIGMILHHMYEAPEFKLSVLVMGCHTVHSNVLIPELADHWRILNRLIFEIKARKLDNVPEMDGVFGHFAEHYDLYQKERQ